MELNLDFQGKENTIKDFIKVLLPNENIKKLEIKTLTEDEEIISLEIKADDKEFVFTLKNYVNIPDQKLAMSKTGLLKLFNKSYPWGGLVGVRPTKLVRRYLNLGYSYEIITEILKDMYFVFPEKIDLLLNVVKKESEYLNSEGVNMYVGIPYCPTRCKYCSFASYEMNSKLGKFYNEFVETLHEEIKLTGEMLKGKNIKIESLYFGGGTPSTLTEKDIQGIIEALYKNIDLSNLREFTFEAGREDTLSIEKLRILKEMGVTRLSLNPQTFNEVTLKNLNRSFDRNHFDYIFKLIKEMDFIINMDFIIGLPGETKEDVLKTFEEVKKYNIDNLTIHFLAIKNGSNLIKDGHTITTMENLEIDREIEEVVKFYNMKPYYMYRQKNSLAWGENIGYAIEGTESLFNIEMIEENQSTIGLGGGAISKKVKISDDGYTSLKRYINPKDPYMYLVEMRDRMKQKKEFFEEL